MTPDGLISAQHGIIAEQKDTIAGLRTEAKRRTETVIMLACALTFFVTLALVLAFVAANLQDKLTTNEAAIAILKK